jgi:hypothetical protein
MPVSSKGLLDLREALEICLLRRVIGTVADGLWMSELRMQHHDKAADAVNTEYNRIRLATCAGSVVCNLRLR